MLVDFGSFHSRVECHQWFLNYTVTRHRCNCQELKYIIFRSALIHALAHFQRTTCSQIYFRFSSYLLRKPHLFVILTAIGWFIVNIQSDLFWHRCLERQAFCTPRMYTLSPSKSIKGSNYGEFLKNKNVLLCTRLYKYAPNLESLLTQQYACVMCTLWSDNTCIFTRFHSVKNANTQLIWSSENTFKRFPSHTKKWRHCKGSSNDYSCTDGINQKSSFWEKEYMYLFIFTTGA